MSARIAYDNGRYTISAPFDIGPRLRPSLKLSDGSRVTIAATGRSEGRVIYEWTVDTDEVPELAGGDDLASGVGAFEVDLEGMFATFASFVGVWVEALNHEGSENRSIFPPWMREWAEANHEELYSLTAEGRACEACNAEPGEPCRVGCLSRAGEL